MMGWSLSYCWWYKSCITLRTLNYGSLLLRVMQDLYYQTVLPWPWLWSSAPCLRLDNRNGGSWNRMDSIDRCSRQRITSSLLALGFNRIYDWAYRLWAWQAEVSLACRTANWTVGIAAEVLDLRLGVCKWWLLQAWVSVKSRPSTTAWTRSTATKAAAHEEEQTNVPSGLTSSPGQTQFAGGLACCLSISKIGCWMGSGPFVGACAPGRWSKISTRMIPIPLSWPSRRRKS